MQVAAQKRVLYHKGKRKAAVTSDDGEESDDELLQEVAELRKKVKVMDQKLQDQQEYSASLEDQVCTAVETYRDGKYTDEVRECCIALLSLGVGQNRIDPVIRNVMKLAGKEAHRLPAPSTINNMIREAGIISKLQLGEVIPQSAFNTLHTDGTTKFGEKFGAFEISTSECSYSLALAEMKSGSATETLDVLDRIIGELDDICEQAGGANSQGKQIVTTIKNTMSDRHSAEKKFSSLLEDYRAEILAKVKTGWKDLSEEEKKSVTRLNTFFCGMHFVVGMADCANESLAAAEKAILGPESRAGATRIAPSFCSPKEAGTIRLIRTVCNAVQKHGSERAGVHIYFAQYLREKGIDSMPLATFRGNRFNIIFHDAAGVYYLQEHLKAFFESYGTDNPLLKAVAADLAEPTFIAGCKALGLLNKFVTGPLWRVLEGTGSILDMNRVYTSMRDQFKEWSEDATSFIEGKSTLFSESHLKKGAIFECLMAESEVDDLVPELLHVLFKSFYLLCERMLVDHLPGGVHQESRSREYEAETASVPNTNTVSERDFAQLDRYLREKPNATTVALESLILFSNNKTKAWLEGKDDQEKTRIFTAARKLAPQVRKKYRERREEIRKHRAQVILHREQERLAKKRKEEARRQQLVDEISLAGLWQTEEDVRKELGNMRSVKQKMHKLKQQIKFRRYVLLQEYPDKSVFNFTKQGRPFSVQKLMENLLNLITATSDPEPFASPSPAKRQRMDPYIQNPELLVGKSIDHTFVTDEVTGETGTFRGTIISQVRVGKNTSYFNISYEGFGDKYWTYQLLEDYINGDISVISHH